MIKIIAWTLYILAAIVVVMVSVFGAALCALACATTYGILPAVWFVVIGFGPPITFFSISFLLLKWSSLPGLIGAELIPPMDCKQCGAEMQEEAKFCPHCGTYRVPNRGKLPAVRAGPGDIPALPKGSSPQYWTALARKWASASRVHRITGITVGLALVVTIAAVIAMKMAEPSSPDWYGKTSEKESIRISMDAMLAEMQVDGVTPSGADATNDWTGLPTGPNTRALHPDYFRSANEFVS